jgi:hypothetical protein
MEDWMAIRRKSRVQPLKTPRLRLNNLRYLSKIIFTYILGYKVDIGHMEAVNLISSPRYSEKQIVSVTGCMLLPAPIYY